MDNIKDLQVIFTGNTTQLSSAFAKVSTESEALGAKLDGAAASSEGFGSRASGAIMSIGKTAAIAGVAVAIASSKMAIDFQQQMLYIKTDAGDTTDNINKLSAAVLNMAKHSQFSPDQLAQGLYHLASLGLRGADALNALNTAQEMAAVGGADLESTASALGAALVTGIKGVQDYTQAAGSLDAIVGAGNMRMQDLVNALGSGVLPVAKNAGLTLNDVGAALATLTDNGMGAEESATRLRMTFALMEAPSKKASGQLASIGMSANQMAMDMRTKGLIPALQDLKTHLENTFGSSPEGLTKQAAALTEIFGGGRSSAAAQTLIEQLSRVQTKFTQIGQQSGEFSTKVSEQQSLAAAHIKVAWDAIQATAIQLGTAIVNVASNIFPKIAEAFRAAGKVANEYLMPSLKALWNAIETQLGPSLVKLYDAVKPLLPILGAVLVGVLWVVINVLRVLIDTISGVIKAVSTIEDAMMKLYKNVISFFANAGTWLYDAGKNLIGGFISGIKDSITGIGSALGSVAKDIGGGVKSALHAIHIPGFASGTQYAPGGMALVGENGPELINLPRGSQVMDNSDTQQAMSGGSVNLTVNVGVVAGNNVQDLAATIYRELQRMARANGFNGQLPNIGVAPTG